MPNSFATSCTGNGTHSSPLAWKAPGTEEPGGLQSWGREESDRTERLHFHFSLSCIGEGNGNPPQCSCLENPRDGGAWWAAVYGVAQSRTRLKRLSSSSSTGSPPGSFVFGIFQARILKWDAMPSYLVPPPNCILQNSYFRKKCLR